MPGFGGFNPGKAIKQVSGQAPRNVPARSPRKPTIGCPTPLCCNNETPYHANYDSRAYPLAGDTGLCHFIYAAAAGPKYLGYLGTINKYIWRIGKRCRNAAIIIEADPGTSMIRDGVHGFGPCCEWDREYEGQLIEFDQEEGDYLVGLFVLETIEIEGEEIQREQIVGCHLLECSAQCDDCAPECIDVNIGGYDIVSYLRQWTLDSGPGEGLTNLVTQEVSRGGSYVVYGIKGDHFNGQHTLRRGLPLYFPGQSNDRGCAWTKFWYTVIQSPRGIYAGTSVDPTISPGPAEPLWLVANFIQLTSGRTWSDDKPYPGAPENHYWQVQVGMSVFGYNKTGWARQGGGIFSDMYQSDVDEDPDDCPESTQNTGVTLDWKRLFGAITGGGFDYEAEGYSNYPYGGANSPGPPGSHAWYMGNPPPPITTVNGTWARTVLGSPPTVSLMGEPGECPEYVVTIPDPPDPISPLCFCALTNIEWSYDEELFLTKAELEEALGHEIEDDPETEGYDEGCPPAGWNLTCLYGYVYYKVTLSAWAQGLYGCTPEPEVANIELINPSDRSKHEIHACREDIEIETVESADGTLHKKLTLTGIYVVCRQPACPDENMPIDANDARFRITTDNGCIQEIKRPCVVGEIIKPPWECPDECECSEVELVADIGEPDCCCQVKVKVTCKGCNSTNEGEHAHSFQWRVITSCEFPDSEMDVPWETGTCGEEFTIDSSKGEGLQLKYEHCDCEPYYACYPLTPCDFDISIEMGCLYPCDVVFGEEATTCPCSFTAPCEDPNHCPFSGCDGYVGTGCQRMLCRVEKNVSCLEELEVEFAAVGIIEFCTMPHIVDEGPDFAEYEFSVLWTQRIDTFNPDWHIPCGGVKVTAKIGECPEKEIYFKIVGTTGQCPETYVPAGVCPS